MENREIKKFSVQKHGHVFDLYVMKGGKVECRIDDGKALSIKQIKDGRVYFPKKQEIIINGDLAEIDGISLDAADFAALKKSREAAQKRGRGRSAGKVVSGAKNTAPGVDAWEHKVYTSKAKDGTEQKYCVHKFQIGNSKYQFVERNITGYGIIINPDYKISEDVPGVGGIPKQYGELIFWDYFFEGKGWQRVRVLTYNELLCLNIIKKQGFFSTQKEDKKEPKIAKLLSKRHKKYTDSEQVKSSKKDEG